MYQMRKSAIWITYAICIMLAVSLFAVEPSFAVSKSTFKKTTVKSLKAANVNHTTINLTWKKVAGADGYLIYVAGKKDSRKYKKIRIIRKSKIDKKAKKVTVNITKRTTDKKLYYKVCAYKKFGKKIVQTKLSDPVRGIAKVAKPAASRYRTIGGTVVRGFVTVGADGQGYQVFRSVKKNGKYKCVKNLPAATAEFRDTVQVGKTYYYKVRCYRVVKGKKRYSKFGAIKIVTMPKRDGNALIYDADNQTLLDPDGPLVGKRILFLGSSVTQGIYSDNESFVECLNKMYGVSTQKEAVSGTTMAEAQANSYVARLRRAKTSAENPPQYVVCQLSSNDAKNLVTLGTMSTAEVTDIAQLEGTFDTKTVAGAIQYIAKYSELKLGCKVIFYVIPEFGRGTAKGAHYQKMRALLYQIRNQWDPEIQILDMQADINLYNISDEDHRFYMVDDVHPTKAGYLHLYVPRIANILKKLLTPEDPGTTDPDDPGTGDDPGTTDPDDPGTGDDPGTTPPDDPGAGDDPGAAPPDDPQHTFS